MKKLLLLIVIMVMLVGLFACSTESVRNSESNVRLLAVPGMSNLYYDSQTKVVYLALKEDYGGYRGYGYMSPYYATNGFPYLYDPFNQELVEWVSPQLTES